MPIFDQGYQHWKGRLSSRGWRWTAIARQGLRGQWQSWIIRIVLITAWLPAVALIVVLALWGLLEQGAESVIPLVRPILPPSVAAEPQAYRLAVWTIAYSTYFKFEIFFIMLLVLIAGPNLISRDLRFNALPLYLSRPVTRLDYFLGKLGVIAVLVAAVAIVPALAAYLLGVCFSLDAGVIRDTWQLLPACLVYGAVIVVSAGTLMLALSSLSRRSLYVGIAWAGLWVISNMVAWVLGMVHQGTIFHAAMQEEIAQGNIEWPPRPRHPTPNPSQGEGPQKDKGKAKGPPGMPSAEQAAWDRVRQKVERQLAEATRENWRPLCSYTANLQRLGEALLNTDASWVELGRAIEAPRAAMRQSFTARLFGGFGAKPPPSNERRLADQMVPQYPWTWSAGVLAGLLALSLWTLSLRVKSLDKLR